VPASGSGTGALLVSLVNVKWRCYAQSGGVEESKFYLYSVVFPVRRISSVSPRFYFRRHTFCFLPLAAILEFLNDILTDNFSSYLMMCFLRNILNSISKFIPKTTTTGNTH
jgi:hypothetical protein